MYFGSIYIQCVRFCHYIRLQQLLNISDDNSLYSESFYRTKNMAAIKDKT